KAKRLLETPASGLCCVRAVSGTISSRLLKYCSTCHSEGALARESASQRQGLHLRRLCVKRKLLIAVPLLALVTLVAWMLRPKHETLSQAFVSEKAAPLLSGIAQVREQIGMLHYSERVDVIGKRNDYVKVRTNSGVAGWVDSKQLMDPPLWQRSIKLVDQTRGMPVQAHGRTKVSTNLKVSPGRTEARLSQFGRNVPVEIVGRAVADWVQVTEEKDASNDPQGTKKEDWLLVRAVATRPPG